MSTPNICSALLILAAGMAGCRSNNQEQASPVSQLLTQRNTPVPEHSEPAAQAALDPAASLAAHAEPQPEVAAPIALVNNQPISRARYEELLHHSHGLFVLEQLTALEMVKQRARSEGVAVSEDEINTEYQQSLRELARPVAGDAQPDDVLRVGEQMLQGFLRDKNISQAEYMLSMERNAYLRNMVSAHIEVADGEVQNEWARRYGPKVVVRHIALPDLRTVSEVRQRLQGGERFSELARAHSLNRSSAEQGGLLPEFSPGDPAVPAAIRRVVFDLQPGQISDAVAVSGQYHLLKVESRRPATMTEMTPAAREICSRAVTDRKIRQAMQNLERQLLKSADIQIKDARLQRQQDSQRRGAQPG